MLDFANFVPHLVNLLRCITKVLYNLVRQALHLISLVNNGLKLD